MRIEQIDWLAPAKLNLMLRITGQRADGYHELQTVFQFIDRSDRLRFQLKKSGQLRCFGLSLPEQNNLILKAARLLKDYTGCSLGAEIHIDKRLPMGGGLGGGSSDAATSLLILNLIWQTGLNLNQLAEIGLKLGADVPVFVHGRAAWAEGIGEKLHFFAPNEAWYIVIVPQVKIETRQMFQSPNLTKNQIPIRIADFMAGDDQNIFQNLVYQHYTEVAQAIDQLNQYGRARLTGTGACVFAELPSYQMARSVQKKLSAQGLIAFASRGYNTSPLHQQLKKFIGVWPSG